MSEARVLPHHTELTAVLARLPKKMDCFTATVLARICKAPPVPARFFLNVLNSMSMLDPS